MGVDELTGELVLWLLRKQLQILWGWSDIVALLGEDVLVFFKTSKKTPLVLVQYLRPVSWVTTGASLLGWYIEAIAVSKELPDLENEP